MKLFVKWLSPRDIKRVEAEFSKHYGFNKPLYSGRHVWRLGPVNTKDLVERIHDYQSKYDVVQPLDVR